jgi:hypothetical protein
VSFPLVIELFLILSSDIIICRLLGCLDSYLDNGEANFLKNLLGLVRVSK